MDFTGLWRLESRSQGDSPRVGHRLHPHGRMGEKALQGLLYKGTGTSLMVQWLRLHTPNAGDPGSIPGQGTGAHMAQIRVGMLQLNILRASTKIKDATTATVLSQPNK